MKIYFCGSIAGGRKYLHTYVRMVSHLKEAGHKVLTEHVAHPGVLDFEKTISPEEIFERDIHWLEECNVVIAEVSHPSLGVGYEVSYALQLGKPVLCLFHEGIFLSSLILGNTSPHLTVKEYNSTEQLFQHMDDFLRERKTSG